MAERILHPKELDVVEIDNLRKGVIPAIPVSNRTAGNSALTIDRISPFEDHRIPGMEVTRATDIVTQLQDTPIGVSMLESSTIWAYSPFL